MSTIRYFNGSRETGRHRNPAIDLMKLEIRKKGKLPANMRYKYILKKKQEAKLGIDTDPSSPHRSYKKYLNDGIDIASMSKTNKLLGRLPSKRAQQALKEIALKKAHKEERALRAMVVVRPQTFSNGHINSKGRIYDIANNQIGYVNTKNGKISAINGWSIGKYKPRSIQTTLAIQDAINKFSPYYINMRKMQQMQQGIDAQQVVNLYGPSIPNASTMFGPAPGDPSLNDYYGQAAGGPRQNIGMTAWGAMSNNAWGTFADNAWGTVSDNAWGTAATDVWGGISAGNLWGVKGPRIWGTGSGRNYIKGIANFMAAMFGLKGKATWTKAEKISIMQKRRSTRGGSGGRTVVRSSAPSGRR